MSADADRPVDGAIALRVLFCKNSAHMSLPVILLTPLSASSKRREPEIPVPEGTVLDLCAPFWVQNSQTAIALLHS
jgi:hypothetical protein